MSGTSTQVRHNRQLQPQHQVIEVAEDEIDEVLQIRVDRVFDAAQSGAAAGAVFGGVIAADKKKGQQAIVGYRNENQCETVYSTKSQQYFAGYKIRYDVLGMSGTVNRQVNQRPRVGSGIDVTVHINAN